MRFYIDRLEEREVSLLTLEFREFKGGHSGVEIDKGRVNALKALAEALDELGGSVLSISGGNADNAIPRVAKCILAGVDKEKVRIEAERVLTKYRDIEPYAVYEITESVERARLLTDDSSERFVKLLCALPSGVIAFSKDIEGLVETSLNLGILRTKDTEAEISFSVRSAKGDEKRRLGDRIKAIAEEFGASYGERGGYPAWEYKKESHLRDVMVREYEKMYGRSPEVIIIHAGLECGILSEKFPGLDAVSIGPDAYDIHTTEERLSIPSFVRVYDYIKTILKEI